MALLDVLRDSQHLTAGTTLAEEGGITLLADALTISEARRFARLGPVGVIGLDCGVGPAGESISGLWYLEALGIPAAVAGADAVRLGDSRHLLEAGSVVIANGPASRFGVTQGQSVAEAAEKLRVRHEAVSEDDRKRIVVSKHTDGRAIVCMDTIAYALPEDRRNVLLTGGLSSLLSLDYVLKISPHGYITSDGGRGFGDSGLGGLEPAEAHGLAWACIDGRKARMGEGLSTYHDGVISAANLLARRAGVCVGMRAAEAAEKLLMRPG